MAVAIAPITVPDNTFMYHVDVDDIQYFEASSAITPGMLVGFVSGSSKKVEPSNSGGAGVDLVGIALDHPPTYNSTTGKSYAFDDAYAQYNMVPVAVRGRVVSYADAAGVTAGKTVILSNATAGYCKDGTTAGSKIGLALTTQTSSGGKFVLEIVRA